MPNPVTIADVEARFRSLSVDEQPVAQALLDDAWAILLAPRNLPQLEQYLTDGSVSTATVVAVVREMVLRVLRNPDGVKQWSVDDYSQTRDSAVSAGLLYVSPDEIALLSPASTGSGAAFTITPGNAGPGYRTDSPLDLDWS